MRQALTRAEDEDRGEGSESPTHPRRSRLRLGLMAVGMVSASLMLGALFGERGLLETTRYKRERDRLAAEIAILQESIGALEAEIEALKKDPMAIERIAREDLTLALPGETVVFLKTAEDGTQQGAKENAANDASGHENEASSEPAPP